MAFFDNQTEVLLDEEVDILLEDTAHEAVLMVYNDEVNTFEWVIESLVQVCKHTFEQAEQCSLFIHFKGKYGVKHGSKKDLRPMKDALLDRGISATVEEC
ncbi:MAG: ATP-dependent Clp protease adaptor ClpS [Chitinophagales bacterium]|nr:ATP-dependent Clp protease adaptor ClpS [Chitinophagales bacterium]MBX7224962.1 ATP-dependent Clp protease adaptor ClpS [Chitinophagales bacterium]